MVFRREYVNKLQNSKEQIRYIEKKNSKTPSCPLPRLPAIHGRAFIVISINFPSLEQDFILSCFVVRFSYVIGRGQCYVSVVGS